jgi:hypothetical protein
MIYGRKHELLFQFEMPFRCPAPVAYSAAEAVVNFVALLSVNRCIQFITQNLFQIVL